MSKKHFVKAAQLCKAIRGNKERALVVGTFVAFFESFSSNFNAETFVSACEER